MARFEDGLTKSGAFYQKVAELFLGPHIIKLISWVHNDCRSI